MRPGPVRVVRELIAQFPLERKPSQLRDVLVELILRNDWTESNAEAHEKADKWESPTQKRLSQEISKYHRQGRQSRINFNSSSTFLVQGACFCEPNDSNELKEKKKRRARAGRILNAFVGLTPNDFEVLCSKICGLLGVEDTVVTQRSADHGIDFFGRLSLESLLFPKVDLNPTIQKQLKIWIVGQAKKYDISQPGTPDIRDLVGSVILARSDAYVGSESPWQELKLRACDPVFRILITTSTLSADAWKLLEESGVVGMDGEMVAAFLADRKVGLNDNEQFAEDEFIAWVNE